MNQARICNPFQNVVASGIAVCDLNPLLGTTLECINLSLGGGAFTKAMITGIQLKANGKVIFDTSGTNLDLIENYKNYASADATKLSINFMEPKAKTTNAFQSGSIDLSPDSGISNLRLEVTIAGATTPTLSAIAEVSPAIDIPSERAIRFLIKRHHKNTQVIGAAGTFSLQVPHLEPSGGGSVFQRIMVYSANMTGMKIQREGITEFETLKAEHEWMQKKALRSPQTNLHVFDPILDGIQAGRVWDTRPANGVRSANAYGIFSAGETITIETEELLPLNLY
jgi:hypothetical protein